VPQRPQGGVWRDDAASHLTNHDQQHDNQAGNNPRQTSPPSLTVT
jgi:hypothetical protein